MVAETGIAGLLLGLGGLLALGWSAVGRVRALPPGRGRGRGGAAGRNRRVVRARRAPLRLGRPGRDVPALLFLGVLCGGTAPRSPAAGAPGAVVFVDPDRPARAGVARTSGVLVATLAACAYVASAVLPAWSDGKSSDAQGRSERPRPSAAALQTAAADADVAARLDPVAVRPLLVGATVAVSAVVSLEARRLLLQAVRRQPTAPRHGPRWPGRRGRSRTAPAPSARRSGRCNSPAEPGAAPPRAGGRDGARPARRERHRDRHAAGRRRRSRARPARPGARARSRA